MTGRAGWVRSLFEALLHASGRSEQVQANAMALATLRPTRARR